MTASSDAEPTTEDQVAGGGAVAESETTAPSLDVPESNPSNTHRAETARSPGVESQSSSATSEGNDDRPRTRVVVYARPPELEADQSGAVVEPKSDPKAEPSPEPERPTYSERARLNAMDSWFRGTSLGAFTLHRLHKLSFLQDGEEETPERNAQIEFFLPQYQKIARDLASFDNMAGFSNFGEAASAFVGQFGASLLSPEGWIPAVKGGTLLARAVKGGLTQAGIQLGTDPVVQWLSIKSRVQESYDPVRTATGAGLGFIGGAGAGALGGSRVGRSPSSSPPVAPNPPRGGMLQPSQPTPPKNLASQKLLSAPISGTANRAVTGNPEIDHRVNGLLAILWAMKQTPEFRSGSGKEFGTRAHSELARRTISSELGIPAKWIEQSFKSGKETWRGRLDSVRTDIILRDDSGKIIAIIDLKTGGSELTRKRVQRLYRETGTSKIPMIELKYDTLTAIPR